MIKSVDVVLKALPLKQRQMKGTVPVAGQQQCVFVRLVGEDGRTGYGEASAWAVFSEQSPAAVAAVVRDLLAPAVLGRAASDRHGLHRAMDAAVPGNSVAKAALDMAALDLAGKQAGVPAADLLGGDREIRIQLSYSISEPDPDRVAQIASKQVTSGYRILKLKTGALDAHADVARLRALRQAAPEALIRLDYNGRGTEQALRVILDPAREAGVDFCEQPFPAAQLERTERLRRWFDVPISLDETITGVPALEPVLRRGLCDVVSIKYGRSGGSCPVVDMARMAERYGVGIYCGGLNETRLGVAAAMHTFSTVGAAGGLVPGSDFYFPFEVLDDEGVLGGPQRDGDVLTLPDQPGLGATLPDEWFGEA